MYTVYMCNLQPISPFAVSCLYQKVGYTSNDPIPPINILYHLYSFCRSTDGPIKLGPGDGRALNGLKWRPENDVRLVPFLGHFRAVPLKRL